MTARNNSRMHLPFFLQVTFRMWVYLRYHITVLKISQNNDNRGRHLEFYSHTGIGNWFQCFPVYPCLNLSSGSGSVSVSGSGSGFRIPDSCFSIRPISFISQKSLSYRRDLVCLAEISFISRESRRDLVSISPEIAFISCRSQRYHKSRRVLDEISARSHLSRRDFRDITSVAEFSSRFR